MVVIRLSRGGSKKRPFFTIVATDRRKPRDGGRIARLGFYNPCAQGQDEPVRIDLEALDHWLSVGAQMSETVAGLVHKYRAQQAAAEKSAPKKAEPKKAAAKKPAAKAATAEKKAAPKKKTATKKKDAEA